MQFHLDTSIPLLCRPTRHEQDLLEHNPISVHNSPYRGLDDQKIRVAKEAVTFQLVEPL
jgi:hypothetical protein